MLCSLALFVTARFAKVVDGITFASRPGAIYLPVREAGRILGWSVEYDGVLDLTKLNGKTLDPFAPRFSDGTCLISLAALGGLGAAVHGDSVGGVAVKPGAKRVEIDLSTQNLKAWQGTRLVFDWKVSSGREGKDTPNGSFRAQEKEPMHISKIYGSPMPFSVHVTGNIYIHGSDRFSNTPGSHGCIRLPVMETRNVAEEFYGWIDSGTPIRIRGSYRWSSTRSR